MSCCSQNCSEVGPKQQVASLKVDAPASIPQAFRGGGSRELDLITYRFTLVSGRFFGDHLMSIPYEKVFFPTRRLQLLVIHSDVNRS